MIGEHEEYHNIENLVGHDTHMSRRSWLSTARCAVRDQLRQVDHSLPLEPWHSTRYLAELTPSHAGLTLQAAQERACDVLAHCVHDKNL